MRVRAAITGSLEKIMRDELLDASEAIHKGMKRAGLMLKAALRGSVQRAGLGRRLAQTWRSRFFINDGMDAASLVFSRAPEIISAFAEGVTIRTRRGKYLAVPTDETRARRLPGRYRRITPQTWPKRWGRLVFIPGRRGSNPVLLAIKTYKRKADKKTVAFVLVPQVRIKKRFDIDRQVARVMNLLPNIILKEFRNRGERNAA